jgi:hypothetical protein
MKKSTTFRVIPLFFLLAILVASCVKDEYRETKPSAQPVLKSGSDFGLPIYMSQNTLIGEAEIYIENEAIVVNVLLNEGYMPSEAHLYAGADAPPSNAPGQFPFHWYAGDGYPISFVIDISDWWDGSPFDWYFALHLKIGNETAWLLPEEGGTNWLNNAGKPIGWGQYFLYHLEADNGIEWEVDDMQLIFAKALQNLFSGDWDPPMYWDFPMVNNYPEFSFCLFDLWLDIYDMDVTFPLEIGHLNPFYADEETDPFFYIKWDGSAYSMIDGAKYDLDGTIRPLLIVSTEFNFDAYSYTGMLLGENDENVEITITFNFEYCP